MSFIKPSTSTNLTTPYIFKGSAASTAQNYIDAEFPNCLDKTNGDTISGAITLNNTMTIGPTGQILVTATSTIITQTGQTFNTATLLNGINTIIGSLTVGDGTTAMNFNVQNNVSVNFENGSVVEFLSGTNTFFNAGSVLWLEGQIILEPTATFQGPFISSSGNAIQYGVATQTMNLSGNTVIDTSLVGPNPIINLSSGALSGSCTLVFPSIVGAVWYLNFEGVDINSQTIAVQVGVGSPTDVFISGVDQFGTYTTPSNTFAATSPLKVLVVTAANTGWIK